MSSASPPRRAASPPLAAYQSAPWGRHPTSSRAGSSSDSDHDAAELRNYDAEQEESAASESGGEDTTRDRRRRQRIHFDVEQLQTVYHLPLKTVSAIVSVGWLC